MKCMESYGIMEDKDVCKAVLDCFGRWEKDGNMRRNEIVTPSFCPSLVFIFANMFCHGLTCMDCFVNCDSVLIFGWICSNLYHSLPNSPITSRCKGTNLHENSVVSSCFTSFPGLQFVCVYLGKYELRCLVSFSLILLPLPGEKMGWKLKPWWNLHCVGIEIWYCWNWTRIQASW